MKPVQDRHHDHQKPAKPSRAVLAIWVILTVIAAGLLYYAPAVADSDVRPLPQDGYQPPEEITQEPSEDIGYQPPVEDTLLPTLTLPVLPTVEVETPFPSPTPETPMPTDTLAPDVLETEGAEMSDSQVTPPATETPGPTITPYITETATHAAAVLSEDTGGEKSGGLAIDWGLFWVGFSIPVLLACGGVLYLLDRRPDLFRQR